MTQETLDRPAALARLIAHDVESIRLDADDEWLQLILRKGFIGFENMPETQLLRELHLRGLQPPAVDLDEDLALDDESSADWDPPLDLLGRVGGPAPDAA
jgi:hypothetical protein